MSKLPLVRYNLLDEPLLGIEDDSGLRESVTLPSLLARLSHGTPTTLTGVQAYQQHPVHAFLVQLAALALVRSDAHEGLEHDTEAWRSMLLRAAELDGGGPEAFALVVDDLAKPAFLQPPVPEGALGSLKNEHTSPTSELDVLITSKNHDVKVERVSRPTVEQWVFGLITLQTTQGFLGAGNYGVARMNGGFASRPGIAFAPEPGEAARFLHDVRALLLTRSGLAERFPEHGGVGLVWCPPWKGDTSLALAELDPFFIEICRRVRLGISTDGTIVARRGSSQVARIDAKAATGNTGDAWTPVARDNKALTMSESGFHYGRVQDLLFGDWQQGAAGEVHPGWGERFWVGQALVRGQGKTGGYHERWLRVPLATERFFRVGVERDRLGERSTRWVGMATDARLRVLKPALLTLLQGGPDKLKFDDDRVDALVARFDAAIDEEFFALLFSTAGDDDEHADAGFARRLVALGERELESATGSMPVPSARRWRAEAHARRVLFGTARKHLRSAFASSSSEQATSSGDPS